MDRKILLNKAFCILASLFCIIFLFSCNTEGIGIFYSLETELPVSEGSLPEEISPTRLVCYGDKYYLAARSFYSRDIPVSGDTSVEGWSKAVSPSEYPFISDLAVVPEDNKIAAIFYSDPTEDQLSATSALFITSDITDSVASWGDALEVDSREGCTQTSLFAIGDYLFVSTGNQSLGYLLKYTSDYINFETSNLSASSTPFLDATYDSVTGNYWFITETKIYSGTSPNLLSENTEPGLSQDKRKWGGIYYSNTLQRVFLSSNHSSLGIIYYYNDDDNQWIPSAENKNASGTILQFYNLTEFPVGTKTYLLAGTLGNGYYEMEITDFSDPESGTFSFSRPDNTTTNDNYYNLGLSIKTIRSFSYDSANTRLFSYTTGSGLWFNIGGDTWNRE